MWKLNDHTLDSLRSLVCNEPRELPGIVVRAIDTLVATEDEMRLSAYTRSWYQSASVVEYDARTAAIAYLGGYGPRSFLKYQEAILAFLSATRFIKRQTRVADIGSGPAIGFAAFAQLWQLMRELSRQDLQLTYTAIDRSPSMLEIAGALAHALPAGSATTFASLNSAELTNIQDADVIIVSNVMNEAEGNTDCVAFMRALLTSFPSASYAIIIDTASEHAARQMCGLPARLGMASLGPCPFSNADCVAWVFREFRKRLYRCEQACLAERAGAARIAKYSLSMMARTDEFQATCVPYAVSLGNVSISGLCNVCIGGDIGRCRPSSFPMTWDHLGRDFQVEGRWPV